MAEIAVRLAGLGKRYRLGGPPRRTRTVREGVVDLGRRFAHLGGGLRRGSESGGPIAPHIWALKDVSFEIEQGQAVGIIGGNGAGKSTLLKVLSRITHPTEGQAEIRGRVGSLLEVGTGFHPELTGGENIYLNGAILGMKKTEIDRKFDQIVAFAEIQSFLETPVKHYSSGMYVRLAFAVAAHLEPEILLVDEVLAVGDAVFQQKCLGKMGEVSHQGRTVLFVSHDLAAVQALCQRAVWLKSGRVAMLGTAQEVADAYIASAMGDRASQDLDLLPRPSGGTEVRLIGLELSAGGSRSAQTLEHGGELTMRFIVRILNPRRRLFAVEWTICTVAGQRILYGSSSPQHALLITPTDERVIVECTIPRLPLAAGAYRVDCVLSVPHQERLDEVESAARFDVVRCDPESTGFNQRSSLAPATTENRWAILSGGAAAAPSRSDGPELD